MERLKSTLTTEVTLPYIFELEEAIELSGFSGFIPITFISDMIAVAMSKLLAVELEDTEYIQQLKTLIRFVQSPMVDTMLIIKLLGQKRDLRQIEKYAISKQAFNMQKVSSSYNYSFDIKKIPDNIKQLLDITTDHEDEIEKLPEEIINILTISSGYGRFIKTSSTYRSTSTQMASYGDIIRIPKHKYIDPLFQYKFSVKGYEYSTDELYTVPGDNLVVGFFIGTYTSSHTIKSLLKLLGALVLQHGVEKNVTVYSFYGESHNKKVLKDINDIIDYFAAPFQLKMYSVDNTASLNTMITENKGSEIIFMPNIRKDCAILPNNTGLCKVNIVSFLGSNYNIKYANICKQTGGIFTTI